MLFKVFQRFFFKCCVCESVSFFGGLFGCLLPRHVLCCLLVACKVLTDNKAHALAKFCKMHQKRSECMSYPSITHAVPPASMSYARITHAVPTVSVNFQTCQTLSPLEAPGGPIPSPSDPLGPLGHSPGHPGLPWHVEPGNGPRAMFWDVPPCPFRVVNNTSWSTSEEVYF